MLFLISFHADGNETRSNEIITIDKAINKVRVDDKTD